MWHVGLEIRDEEDVGELAIASPPGMHVTRLSLDEHSESEILAIVLLSNVIEHHRCVVTIDVNFVLAVNPHLLSILENKGSVKKLIISCMPSVPYCETIVVQLFRKLAISSDEADLVLPQKCPCSSQMLQFAAPMEERRTLLVKLDVAAVKMSGNFAQQFFDVLLKNNTISELTVGASVFTPDSMALPDCFVNYLGKEDSALKKLTMTTPMPLWRGLHSLLRAIVAAKTLQGLVIHTDIYFIHRAEYNALLEEIFARNRMLRELRVTRPARRAVSALPDPFIIVPREGAARIDPWLSALQTNSTLSALALDFWGFSNDECCAFLRALEPSKALKSVFISYLPACADLKEICGIIRQSHLAKKVYIADYFVSSRSLSMLPECPQMSSLTISCLSPTDTDLFRRTLYVLSLCSHVTSVRVSVDRRLLGEAEATIAAYITEAHALQDLTVEVLYNILDRQEHQQDPMAERCLVEALAFNGSLCRIELKDLALSDENCEYLANALLKSRTLTELSLSAPICFFLPFNCNNAFIRTLASGIDKNYNLLRVDFSAFHLCDAELRLIRSVTRRNASLVAGAARFVMGDHSVYNARTVELVSGHASVLRIVQEEAGVEADEAKAMIRRALRLPCLTDLDEYMKLAGVVKTRVECIGRPGDKLQLDELDNESWLHIRKWLIVADVVKTTSVKQL